MQSNYIQMSCVSSYLYCRHRGHSSPHTSLAMSSPQKCLLPAGWETLFVAGQACQAGMVCVCVDIKIKTRKDN